MTEVLVMLLLVAGGALALAIAMKDV